jgi:hypothetical protein
MTPPPLPEVAGVSLRVPRVHYEAGAASLARPHPARALDGATLVLHPPEADPTASFEMTPFLAPAVQSYLPPPAVAWRCLLVDQRLLSRPEIVWTGTLPEGWNAGVAAPLVEAITESVATLHRRYRSLVEERWSDYMLRTLECAECRDARAALVPPSLHPWQRQMRLAPTGRCPHATPAMRGLDALCRAHPELTFELLGWLTPAGARAAEEGAPATRFALVGPVMDAVLGPWLVGEERRLASRTCYRGYEGSTRPWGRPPDPRLPVLPRAQLGGVSLAASAWGFTGEPEALVHGDASAEPPALDRTAAPPFETAIALPGEAPRGKAARARKRKVAAREG